MLASGKTGEGAYVRDRDIPGWRPLPIDDRHMDAQSLYFTGHLMEKNDEVSYDMT